MSHVKITEEFGIRTLRVNRASMIVRRIVSVTRVSPYKWTGKIATGEQFTVWGGKRSGGAANEWFVELPSDWCSTAINCGSLIEGFRIVENT